MPRRRRVTVVPIWLAGPILISVMLGSCRQGSTGGDVEGRYFPTHPDTGMSAAGILEGVLTRTPGCLVLDPESQGQRYLPIWSGSVRWDEQASSIVDADGHVLATIGQHLNLTGGEVSLESAGGLAGEPIPDACQVGGYWNATDIEVD
jgi:hypothetical protein